MQAIEHSCMSADGEIRLQAAPGSAGYPVMVHPGTPGCRLLFHRRVEKAAAHGIRLISFDRPGYCDTPGRPGRRVADVAQQAAAVADFLGLGTFAVWGFSGGGPFALACAALLGERISGAVVMASLAPYGAAGLNWAREFSEAARTEIELFFTDQEAHRKLHAESVARFARELGEPEGWLSRWGERAGGDEAHSLAVAEHLARVFRESLSHGDEGWYEDDVAFLSPWGFDLGAIEVPVQLWHGTKDANAPVSHGLFLARQIGSIEPHIVDGADHGDIEDANEEAAWAWLLATREPSNLSRRRG